MPPAAMIQEVFDALVAAGVPDREARAAAEAVARRGAARPAPPPAGDLASDSATVLGVLLRAEAASADRLLRLRLGGSALVAGLVALAVALFGAFPDARLLFGAVPVHGAAAPLALAVLGILGSAGMDRRERRRLADARDAVARVAPSGVVAPARPERGGGIGPDLAWAAALGIVGALAYGLLAWM